MTEDEKKNLREHFLEPETRCDTFISAEMKTVWKVQMDILEEIMNICNRHKISYTLSDGSLLGAIRHKGYIPWDDDIDISMLRLDYDRFCKIAPQELKHPYFFQNGETDSAYTEQHVKIRNSETTAVTAMARHVQNGANQGIFVDVFPLDNIPSGLRLNMQLHIQKLLYGIRSRALSHWRPTYKSRIASVFCRIIFKTLGHKNFYRIGECVLRNQPYTGIVGHRFWKIITPNEHYRIDWLREIKIVPYEYLDVPVPREYEEVLMHQFGDWNKFVKGATFHTELYFNPHESYKTVIPREFGYKVY